MTRSERALTVFLRFQAVVLLLAFLAVVMPRAWMAATNDALGLAELPDNPLVAYLARSLSGLYAYHGVLTLTLATDVRRFAPLIRVHAYLNLTFGLGLVALDLAVGLPLWWALVEGPSVATTGLVTRWLLRRCEGEGAA